MKFILKLVILELVYITVKEFRRVRKPKAVFEPGMTDAEWWKEFGTCPCEQCQESTEIQSERMRLQPLF